MRCSGRHSLCGELVWHPAPARGTAGLRRESGARAGFEVQFPDVYLEAGASLSLPPFSALSQNATPDGVVSFLSSAIGMPANSSEPRPGETRRPIQATLRHALALVFQRQDEIASPRLLFTGSPTAGWPNQSRTLSRFFSVRPETIAFRNELSCDGHKSERAS